MLSGPEIQAALHRFVSKWRGYSGTEKAEAQSFLNELFACYGSDRREVGALFEDFAASAGFMDLHWPGLLIVEMKAPQVSLEKAKDQRQRYWQESSDVAQDRPAARFVIACAFREFEIWEPGRFPNEARITFPLAELKLYNLMDDGAFTDLAALHKQLDVAVAAAYGWPASVAQDAPELVRRLTELNREIVEGGREYSPFDAVIH